MIGVLQFMTDNKNTANTNIIYHGAVTSERILLL